MTSSSTYYDLNAKKLADLYESVTPKRTHELITRYFISGDGYTYDIGCGSGRDCAYLKSKDYRVIGLDPSEAMLAEARVRHPGIEFRPGTLPDLSEINEGSADNILCSGVLMHLPAEQVITAVSNLKRRLRSDGILILSYRTPGPSDEEDTRQMTLIEVGRLSLLFESLGMRVLHQETTEDLAGRGHQWHTFVVQNASSPLSEGLVRVQSVLEHDKKTATYKLALMRGLCLMTVRDSNTVRYSPDGTRVFVPVRKMAEYWLQFYWKLTATQQTNDPRRPAAFFKSMKEFQGRGKTTVFLQKFLEELDEGKPSRDLETVLREIASTLVRGPVQYSGTRSSPIFTYHAPSLIELRPESPGAKVLDNFIGVPFEIWRDITNFSQWVHDSILVRWAELVSGSFDRETEFETVMRLLREDLSDERDQSEIRRWMKSEREIRSVWSRKRISFDQMCVDHILPISIVGNNDLWNLMPSHKNENAKKSARIPTLKTLETAKSSVLDYWSLYEEKAPQRFRRQIGRALEEPVNSNWKDVAYGRMIELAERVANTRSLERWSLDSTG